LEERTFPAWAPDGNRIAFSSSQSGDPEIYVSDNSGRNLKRITTSRDRRLAVVESEDGFADCVCQRPQRLAASLYHEADGTNPQRMTDQGYAVSPAWSPNGQFLAFSWMRKYGPELPGAQDIYIRTL